MNKRFLLNKTRLCIVISVTLLNFAGVEGSENNTGNNFQPVPPDQISSILTMISDKIRNNYDNIKTWQGKVDATVSVIYEGAKAERVFYDRTDATGEVPKKVKEHRESTVEFAADCEKGFFNTNKFSRNPIRYTEANSGRVLGVKPNPGYNRSIGTPEYKIRCFGSAKRGNSIMTRTAIKEKRISQEECPTCGEDVYDPRSALLFGLPVWEAFPLILQYIQKNGELSIGGHSLHIEKRVDGTITEYRMEQPGRVSPGQYLIQTSLFSSENDFNVTLVEEKRDDGKLLKKMTWDYEVIGSVYLPIRTTKQDFTGENAELRYDRECIFTNLRLNQAIPESTFADENCGLREGEKLIDHTNNKKEFVLKNGKLVEHKGGKSNKRGSDLFDTVSQETNPSLYVVSSTPELPAKLIVEERLVFDVFYDLPKEFEQAGILARPYSNGEGMSGYKVHKASRISNSKPSGIVECWFSFEKPAAVDEVRIIMIDLSRNIIHTGSMPIDAEWVNDK